MADGLSLVLWSLAEYFNYFSVTLIILCSGLMTAFIIRLNGDHWGRYHNGVTQGGSSLAFQKVVTTFTNPFFLKLSSTTVSSLSDGVWLEVSCLGSCVVHVYWGVVISPVHAALLKEGTDFLKDMRTGVLLSSDCLAINRHRLQTTGRHSIHLSVPDDVSANSLGPAPRHRYPCVVTLATTDSCITEHTSVVAVVTVLHLKDSQCPMQTYIIAQYAKMAGQAVYNLQPLFFASESEDSDAPNSQTSQHGDAQETSQAAEANHKLHSTRTSTTTQHLSTNSTDSVTSDTDREHRPSSSKTTDNPWVEHVREVGDDHSQDWERVGATNSDGGQCGVHDLPYQRQESGWERALPECIVCQSQPLNCVLLPCRHTCVCQKCFHKLDRCPMCRSHIESFFTLTDDGDEDDADLLSSGPDEAVPLDLYSRFERFNQRLNNFLGFE